MRKVTPIRLTFDRAMAQTFDPAAFLFANVGSAYGKTNLLGRWLNYSATGHGGNKQIRKCKQENLRFTILERVSPDMISEEITQLENTWKNRLHTREFGLNSN